jgi:hypothetical protein
MFQRNMSLPLSESKDESSKKPAELEQSLSKASSALLSTYFHAGFLLGAFFDPEDGGDMFL